MRSADSGDFDYLFSPAKAVIASSPMRNMGKPVNERREEQWKDLVFPALIFMHFFTIFTIMPEAAYAQSTREYLCTRDANKRRFELRHESAGELPCALYYCRDAEPGKRAYESDNTPGFCEDRLQDFIKYFEEHGYQCSDANWSTMCHIQYPRTWQAAFDLATGRFFFFPALSDALARSNVLVEVSRYGKAGSHNDEDPAPGDGDGQQEGGEISTITTRVLDEPSGKTNNLNYSQKKLSIKRDQRNGALSVSADIEGGVSDPKAAGRQEGVRFVCKADKSLELTKFASLCQQIIEATTMSSNQPEAGICPAQRDRQ
jgi:hypothetical protein